jgi:hypothetical protein
VPWPIVHDLTEQVRKEMTCVRETIRWSGVALFESDVDGAMDVINAHRQALEIVGTSCGARVADYAQLILSCDSSEYDWPSRLALSTTRLFRLLKDTLRFNRRECCVDILEQTLKPA